MSSGAIIETRGLRKVYRVGKVDVQALRGVDLQRAAGRVHLHRGAVGIGEIHAFPYHRRSDSADLRTGNRRRPGSRRPDRCRPHATSAAHRGFRLSEIQSAAQSDGARQHCGGALYRGKRQDNPTHEFEEILRLLGIDNRLDHKPNALSGGEQQRVAIARAIVNHPAILLADEPTGNLDTENSKAVLEVLRDLNERLGQTILMITHNPEAAVYGHHIVHMRDGKIIERS